MNFILLLNKMNRFYLPKNIRTACTLLFVFTVMLFSCSPVDTTKAPALTTGFSKVFNQGPVSLTMQLSSTKITIAEQLELMLQAAVPEEYEVEMPGYTTSLGDFSVDDFHTRPPRLTGAANTRIVVQKTFILKPYLPGAYTIPPLTILYRKGSESGVQKELRTEEVQVIVTSYLPPDATNLQIKDIKPPVELPLDITRLLWLAGLLLLFIILGVAGFLYWRETHAKKEALIIQISPDELAFQELDKLLAEDLLARGEVKLFHLRISDILRSYIENRFGLKAPERTTEEFLTELTLDLQMQKALINDHKRLLAEFLNQCDLVKFAKHEPTIVESEKTVIICREFVEETKLASPSRHCEEAAGPTKQIAKTSISQRRHQGHGDEGKGKGPRLKAEGCVNRRFVSLNDNAEEKNSTGSRINN
jgi:hypothetical protein